jgi:hypothetical protein
MEIIYERIFVKRNYLKGFVYSFSFENGERIVRVEIRIRALKFFKLKVFSIDWFSFLDSEISDENVDISELDISLFSGKGIIFERVSFF